MNASQLNPPGKYDIKEGRYIDAMPALRAAALRPLSTAEIMKARLDAFETKDSELRAYLMEGWHDYYLDTPDGIAYHGNGVKVVREAPLLLGITPQSSLRNGALVLTPEEYAALEGEEFTRERLEKAGLNDSLSKRQVLNHPVWRALARGDKALLREYRDMVFAEGKRRWQYDSAMGIYVLGETEPSLRAWVLDGLDYGSNAVDRRRLDGRDARLVGVRESASEASAPNLEQRVQRAAQRR
ncbi:hypothetical protein HYS48_00935 [Candidatus Woesearchaeota archaeon]|nr:hypothetical protein [Candidatus Woesearchaeota archaeon]